MPSLRPCRQRNGDHVHQRDRQHADSLRARHLHCRHHVPRYVASRSTETHLLCHAASFHALLVKRQQAFSTVSSPQPATRSRMRRVSRARTARTKPRQPATRATSSTEPTAQVWHLRFYSYSEASRRPSATSRGSHIRLCMVWHRAIHSFHCKGLLGFQLQPASCWSSTRSIRRVAPTAPTPVSRTQTTGASPAITAQPSRHVQVSAPLMNHPAPRRACVLGRRSAFCLCSKAPLPKPHAHAVRQCAFPGYPTRACRHAAATASMSTTATTHAPPGTTSRAPRTTAHVCVRCQGRKARQCSCRRLARSGDSRPSAAILLSIGRACTHRVHCCCPDLLCLDNRACPKSIPFCSLRGRPQQPDARHLRCCRRKQHCRRPELHMQRRVLQSPRHRLLQTYAKYLAFSDGFEDMCVSLTNMPCSAAKQCACPELTC
jgi:hypothetical protein